jgi:hypothetical protein
VPVGSTVWKTDLLDGVINPDVARSARENAKLDWHNFGRTTTKEARLQFMEDSLFLNDYE